MRLGVIQSNYIPWRGYFDFIRSVDLFVIHDDLQYTKGDWRNRNRIKTQSGLRWITVPVHYNQNTQHICDTQIDYSTNWLMRHINLLKSHYAAAPHLDDALEILSVVLGGVPRNTISELNVDLIRSICGYLGISTPIVLSSNYALRATRTERLIELIGKTGADVYLSGSSAEAYLDKELFLEKGIRLEYKAYDYEPYPQLFGTFEGAVSILDLIANCGRTAQGYISSRTPNRVVIP